MNKLISFLLLLSFTAYSQDNNKPVDLKVDQDYSSIWDVEKQNLMSPFTTPAVWILGAGTIASYLMYQDRKDKGEIGYSEDLERKGKKTKRKGSWQYYGDLIGWGVLQSVYTLTQLPGIYRGEERAIENTEIMWKSTLYTSLTTGIMKLAIKEPRQTTEGKMESFPSGHASATFAFATNLALRHEWYWSVLAAPFVFAASTARVSSDDHYLHDAVFGAALGMSFAYGMNYVSDNKKVPFLLGYEPMEDGGGLHLKFSF